jgi:hypothetical protein
VPRLPVSSPSLYVSYLSWSPLAVNQPGQRATTMPTSKTAEE